MLWELPHKAAADVFINHRSRAMRVAYMFVAWVAVRVIMVMVVVVIMRMTMRMAVIMRMCIVRAIFFVSLCV